MNGPMVYKLCLREKNIERNNEDWLFMTVSLPLQRRIQGMLEIWEITAKTTVQAVKKLPK